MAGTEKEVLPDHLRCKRTDGRKWRCSRRAMDGNKFCEVHHLQFIHRQLRRNAKRERESKSKVNSLQVRASKCVKIAKKRKRCVSEALDDALKKMKLKRGDLQLELIRVFLKRQVEKKKMMIREKELELEIEKENSTEARELVLPNAVVAIEQPSSRILDNAGASLGVKLGLGHEGSSTAFSQRHFRSKNIEPKPISTMQIVPCTEMLRKKRKKCHWCRRSDTMRLIKCLNCRKQFFCGDCIKQRSIEMQEIKAICPVCRGACSCSICLKGQSRRTNHKELSQEKMKVHKIHVLQHLICKIRPVLSQINRDQSIELDREVKIKGLNDERCFKKLKSNWYSGFAVADVISALLGKVDSEIQIQQGEPNRRTSHCCSNCKMSIVDYHRSCANCSYKLCLSCCLEFCHDSSEGLSYSSGRRKSCSSDDQINKIKQIKSRSGRVSLASPMVLRNWEASPDGSISCPPANFGGCGESLLELRCTYPLCWLKELEDSADEVLNNYKFHKTSDDTSCLLCNVVEHNAGENSRPQEVAMRIGSGLYCPTLKDLHDDNLEHFQRHWSKGQPVMVPHVLRSKSAFTWDPVVLFCAYLEMRSSLSSISNGTNCLDWCEVEISAKRTFIGSLEGQTHANMRRKTIKFNAWLSSHLLQEHFPAQYAETLHALPLQEYMNPNSGLLNLAIKLPGELLKPELGPCIYISYSGPEDLMQAESLTKLCYDSCDVVNILAYATDVPISEVQLGTIKKLMKKYKAQDRRRATSNSSDQKEKSSLHSEDTEESGLQDMSKEGSHLPSGIDKVPFFPGDSLQSQILSAADGNTSHDSDFESESDSEASILCSGTIEGSEDLEDNIILQGDVESSSSPEKKMTDSCGAQWDIFRREDVPKLVEYLKRHSNEFSSSNCYSKHVVHPILDQSYFLDAFHKLRLKKEFDIQPWTIEQHPGEAIIIPAGCPYQIKKLKSCVNIVLDFISPESASECIKLTDEIRLLPMNHKARGKMLEVRKMALSGISAAIEEIRDLTQTRL